MQLSPEAWRDIIGCPGTKGELVSRFTHARIRPAHPVGCGVPTAPQHVGCGVPTAPPAAGRLRDYWRNEPQLTRGPELTVLAEWPDGEAEPTKIWFANIHADTSLEHLVQLAELRWRIERADPRQDRLELEQELGLGHYAGRGWRGFHHHASLCIAACGYLLEQRSALSPSGNSRPGPENGTLPETYIPRGSPRKTREAYPERHRHHARPYRRPTCTCVAAMSVLFAASRRRCRFMTQ